jgi:SAM-dependent methyltransferase
MKGLLSQMKQFLLPSKPPAAAGRGIEAGDWLQCVRRLQEHSARFGNAPCLLATCNVCGETTAFYCKETPLARESYLCAGCITTSRYRSVARGVLRFFAEELGVEASSLRELRNHRLPRPIRIYDTQLPFAYLTCAYPIPLELAAIDGVDVQLSRFRCDDPLGSPIDGKQNVTNQNLERLTFPDGHFDLVITSDVMEHVRLDDLAHREIRRVLGDGGAYVFNVPHTREAHETMHRVVVRDPDDPEQDDYVMEREYHGDANDPENAALSYRVYGKELDDSLRSLGFDVDYAFYDHSPNAVVNTELFYCRASRPHR